MRTIKFRAWDTANAKMVYSDDPPSFSFWKWLSYNGDDLATLMQSTGIKDKREKEVYEGDIIRCGDAVTKVVWDYRLLAMLEDQRHEWEVVANVYDYPHQ